MEKNCNTLSSLSFACLKKYIDDITALKDETATSPVLAITPVVLEKSYIEERITNIFITIGIPANINGYHFLRDAIKLAVGDYKIISNITKELYPKVAARFDTSPYKVERGIRHAIEVAWNKGKIININSIFGLTVYEINEKPSNGEFIALLADKMLFESLDCKSI